MLLSHEEGQCEQGKECAVAARQSRTDPLAQCGRKDRGKDKRKVKTFKPTSCFSALSNSGLDHLKTNLDGIQKKDKPGVRTDHTLGTVSKPIPHSNNHLSTHFQCAMEEEPRGAREAGRSVRGLDQCREPETQTPDEEFFIFSIFDRVRS